MVYLYNPFRAEVLEPVLDALLAGPRRDIALLYHTPAECESIERRPAFTRVLDLGFGAIYRRTA